MLLIELARTGSGKERLCHAEACTKTCGDRHGIDETGAQGLLGAAERAPLRAHRQGLAGHERRGAVAHGTPDDEAALDHELGLDAEEARPPQHDIGDLAGLERADEAIYAEGTGGID